MRDTPKSARKTTKRNLAIPTAADSTPVIPKTPATSAMMRKIMDQRSIFPPDTSSYLRPPAVAIAGVQEFLYTAAIARGGGGVFNGVMSKTDYPKPPFPKQHQDKPGLESRLDPKPRYKGAVYRAADKLKDKKALITGGDSGIGRAVAVLFAREGADVALVHLPEEESDAIETLKAVESLGRRCVLIPGDVKTAQFARDAVSETVRELGRLDILVNNAAYQQSREGLEDLSEEQWDRTFKTNIYGYYHMTRAALKHMKAGGVIINCGSVTGFRGSKKLLDYSATKGAIHAFTKSLALNLIDKGIRVNCVAPGPVWTPLNPSDRPPEEVAEFGKGVPMGRPAQPEEIAPAFVFLASNADSSYITGEVIGLQGGET
jgi:NAD(P)-dependent dehydrogenase (short-subunit alcohol dehydrogenase family)